VPDVRPDRAGRRAKVSPLDAVLDALARRFGTRGLCRMAHGANHLRPSLVGRGSYRCAVCGAGFGSPAEAGRVTGWRAGRVGADVGSVRRCGAHGAGDEGGPEAEGRGEGGTVS